MTAPLRPSVDVLQRVSEGRPLCNADGPVVRQLVAGEYMHSNPVHVPGEVCPYRLTDKGRRALATALRRAASPEGQQAPEDQDAGPPWAVQGQDAPPEYPPPVYAPEAPKPEAPKAAPAKAKAGKSKPKAAALLADVGAVVTCPQCAAQLCEVAKPIDGGPIVAPSYFRAYTQAPPSSLEGLPFRCQCGAAWCERKYPKLRLHLEDGWVEGGK